MGFGLFLGTWVLFFVYSFIWRHLGVFDGIWEVLGVQDIQRYYKLVYTTKLTRPKHNIGSSNDKAEATENRLHSKYLEQIYLT